MVNVNALACQIDDSEFEKNNTNKAYFNVKNSLNSDKTLNYGDIINEISADFAAKGENVALARTLVTAMIVGTKNESWDVTLSTLEEIKVAVSEAVSNAIIHGYGGDITKSVHMKVEQLSEALVVEISDNGCGIIDIEQAMEPDFTTGEEHLGLGFAFMSSFMDEVDVESIVGCGTKVTLVKKLKMAEV